MARNNNNTAPPVDPEPANPETAGKSAPAVDGQVIYVGPTIMRDKKILQSSQIFSKGVPPEWKAYAAAEPTFRMLLVPVAGAARALAELANPGSMLSGVAKKIALANPIQRQQKGGK